MPTIMKVFVRNNIASICISASHVMHIIPPLTASKIINLIKFPKMHLLVRKILIPTTNFSGIDNKPQDGKPTCNLLHKLWDIGSTPINTSNFDSLLVNYPNKEIATVLSNGFKNGFSLQYTGIRKKVEFKNMISAEEHAVELHEKINKEIKLGRILGPFPCPPISNLRCNPIGILPKKQGGGV